MNRGFMPAARPPSYCIETPSTSIALFGEEGFFEVIEIQRKLGVRLLKFSLNLGRQLAYPSILDLFFSFLPSFVKLFPGFVNVPRRTRIFASYR